MVKATKIQTTYEEWVQQHEVLDDDDDNDLDVSFHTVCEGDSILFQSVTTTTEILEDNDDDEEEEEEDDDDEPVVRRRRQHRTPFRTILISSDDEDISQSDEFHQPSPRRRIISRPEKSSVPVSHAKTPIKKPSSKVEPDKIIVSISDTEEDPFHLDFIPNKFKRPPKLGPRTTSESNIFDFSDSDRGEAKSDRQKRVLSPTKTPGPKAKSGKTLAPATIARLKRKEFEENREQFANNYLKQLDETVNGGAVGRLTARTGGIKLVWTNSKHSTAGDCWTRSIMVEDKVHHFECVIRLEIKVCDDYSRVMETLAHEYTHACVFILELDRRQLEDKRAAGHGRLFQSWAKKVSKAMDIPVPSTCHNYTINYKYEYECSGCHGIYRAHSRRKDWTTTKGCEKCRLPLVQIKPAPRTVKKGEGGIIENTPTPYQVFQKENFSKIKAELPPGTPFGDVQRELGRRWKEAKALKDPGLELANSISKLSLQQKLEAVRDNPSKYGKTDKENDLDVLDTIKGLEKLVIEID